MDIVIIGSGNVGTVLGKMAHRAGHRVLQVFSRHLQNASALATQLDAKAVDSLSDITQEADLFLVALSDAATANLPHSWKAKSGLICHTAGALSMNILKQVGANIGVLYPLQSLTKERIPEKPFPLLIDSNNGANHEMLAVFANSLSPIVRTTGDEERLKLHLSAVIVNNFSNHLFALAEDYCNRQGLDFSLLRPIILETAERLETNSAASMQTGPAIRNDQATLEKHLDLLKEFPQMQQLYNAFTESIRLLATNR